MKSYEAYLFDLDGTLINSEEMIIACFEHSMKEAGDYSIAAEQVLSHIGIPLKKQFEIYLDGRPSKHSIEDLLEIHMQFQLKIWKDHLKLYPKALEVVKELHKRGKKLALVTSRRKATCDLYTKHFGLFDYFEVIMTPESSEKHKPDPEPANIALSKLGVKASDTLFIGDAIFDIACGHAAGCETAYVSWGFRKVEDLEPSPDYLLKSFEDLL